MTGSSSTIRMRAPGVTAPAGADATSGAAAGVPAVALVEDRFDPPGRGIAAPEGAAERLVVARVDDRGAVGLEAVAERYGGVVEVLRDDPRAADRVRALAQVREAERGGELAQGHREIRELHLAGERLVERAFPLRAVEGDRVPRVERRREEREALDVVPVRVAEEDARPDGHPSRERVTERARAGPAIEDEDVSRPGSHLDARGVAAEANRPGARRWKGAAGAPEPHLHVRRAPPARVACAPGSLRDAVHAPQPRRAQLALSRRVNPLTLHLGPLSRERPRAVAVRVVGAPHDVVRCELGHRPHTVEVLLEGRVHLRSEEHTSELQSHSDLVCRLLLEKKKKQQKLKSD